MDDDAKPEARSAPGPSADDLEAMAGFARALADGVERALPGWVRRAVEERHLAGVGAPAPEAVRAQAEQAGRTASEVVGGRVRALLELDVDDQRTGPLAVVRGAVPFPTEVLRAAGVPPVERDQMAVRQFPDDDYDLAPATFADLDPDLHEVGLVWGAAKAHVHLARRRAEGAR